MSLSLIHVVGFLITALVVSIVWSLVTRGRIVVHDVLEGVILIVIVTVAIYGAVKVFGG